MGHKKVTYSLPNLKNLVGAPNSCVYCIEDCKKTLTVFPVHLDNIKTSVNEILRTKVTTYDTILKGIVLGYNNIKVFNQVQLNDDGNFGLDYSADIYLFKPEVGQLLTGEVNKKSKDHIGVLVHSFFNASIPRPRNDNECPKNWMGFEINIGQSVTFEVIKVNFSGRMPFIKGKLIDVGEHDTEDKDSGIGSHESMEEISITKDGLESPEVSVIDTKKKKKKKKSVAASESDEIKNTLEEDELRSKQLQDAEHIHDLDESQTYYEKKKKKKRKKKHSDLEQLETEAQQFDVSPEYVEQTPKPKKNKKGKKRKYSEVDTEVLVEPGSDVNMDEQLEFKPQKKKKKKKHYNESEDQV